MTGPKQLYANAPRCDVVIFDLRDLEAVRDLHTARARFQEAADLEALGPNHMALILRPYAVVREAT